MAQLITFHVRAALVRSQNLNWRLLASTASLSMINSPKRLTSITTRGGCKFSSRRIGRLPPQRVVPHPRIERQPHRTRSAQPSITGSIKATKWKDFSIIYPDPKIPVGATRHKRRRFHTAEGTKGLGQIILDTASIGLPLRPGAGDPASLRTIEVVEPLRHSTV